jgi:DNA-sulfur modification-associated/Mrr N-terminal domain
LTTENLDRLQQMFTDLNRYAHKTSKSLDVLYDHRDHLSALTMEVAENVPAFRGQIDKERISLPASSPKLLTLSALYDANVELLGEVSDRPKSAGFAEKVRQATQYWITVADAIPDWQRVGKGILSAPELRKEKINTHSVVLRALGGIGNVLLTEYPLEWRTHVQRLVDIDWRKSVGASVNPLWDNVCIVAGSVVSNRQARRAVLAVLKRELGQHQSNQETSLLHSLEREVGVGRLPRGARTPVGDYYQPILQALNESGGAAKVNDVLERVEQLMKGMLREVDYEPLASDSMLRWRKTAQWARDAMVKEGLLKSNSPRGIWEITEAGRMLLTKGAS